MADNLKSRPLAVKATLPCSGPGCDRGRRKCVVVAPSVSESTPDEPNRQAKFPAPFGNRLGVPAKCKASIVAAIVLLVISGGPSAVAGLVIPVVVDPVNPVLDGWALANVRKECLEIKPPLTNANATPTVPCIGDVPWVPAPMNHSGPRTICRGCGPVRASVAMFSDDVSVEASAAFLLSVAERAPMDCRLFSAVADAVPRRLSAHVSLGSGDYSQSPELTSS